MRFRKVFRIINITLLVFALAGATASSTSADNPLPIFDVTAATDWISGSGWSPGVALQISVNDPATPANPDHVDNLTSGAGGDFSYESPYDIQTGFTVLVTDFNVIKQLTVSSVEVVVVDWVNQTVSGTGTPNAAAATWVLRPDNYVPFTIDADGNWQVDLSSMTGFYYDTWGYVIEQDANGDGIRVKWAVPSFHANIAGVADNHIDGFNWPHGDSVTLTVDDPATPASPDFTDTQTAGAWDWRPYEVRFVVQGVSLAPGHVVIMTNGDMTKTHTILNLEITEANYNTEVIQGKADKGAEVTVDLFCDNCPSRLETADVNGDWTADFSVAGDQPGEDPYDISPDIQVGSMRYDSDGDTTRFDIFTADPWFYIWFGSINQSPLTGIGFDVHGYAWPLNTAVTLTIDNIDTPASPDYTRIAYMEVPPWGGNPQLVFDTSGIIVHTGDIFTMTDGVDTITHTITPLTVSELNHQTDTISGTAEPGSLVAVSLNSSNAWRNVTTGPDGRWLADFSIPGIGPEEQDTVDLVSGMEVWASQSNAGNSKAVNCYHTVIPNPYFEAWPNDDRLAGLDWPAGATVQYEVNDPLTPQTPDFSGSLITQTDPANPNFIWFETWTTGYDLKTGDIVTMTDGMNNKATIVAALTVNNPDRATDTISGTAAPGTEIRVWSDDGSERVTNADLSGNWGVDFSVEQNGQPIVDLVIGSTGQATVSDVDNNMTKVGWEVVVSPCQAGNTVAGTVFEHDQTTPVADATVQFENFTTGDPLFMTTTGPDGQFTCSLPEGDYRVQAWSSGYSNEYYSEAIDATAGLLQITPDAQLMGINFTISPLPIIENFSLNLDRPLLQDPIIRQAIALGTDRQRILDTAFLPNGIYGMVANSIVPPEHWTSAPASELVLYPFDPDQARNLLAAAGWIDRDSDGYCENASGEELAFDFKTRDIPFRVASGMIFLENMADIGIRVTATFYPQLAGPNGFLDQRDFDIAEFAWGSPDFDNEPYIGSYYATSPWNISGYNNPVYDTALENARAAVGDAAKLPYLYEAQSILSQDLPVFPLFTRFNMTPVDTPAGANITVSPEPWLTVHFGEVTQPGVTGVVATYIHPDDLPVNFDLLGPGYSLGTSANFTGAQVCFGYDDTDLPPGQESAIRLYHQEDATWTDITDAGYPNTTDNTICGTVTGFSPFTLLIPSQPAAFNKTVPANNATNQPLTLTLTWETSTGADSYEYCYDTSNDNLCSGPWTSTGAETSKVISGLAFGTRYYWQVRAHNPGGITEANAGTWWTFTTKSLLNKTFYSSGAQDGWILESAENSNVGGSLNSTSVTLSLGDNAQKKQYRAILSFATGAGLPDNAVITGITLKVKKQGVLGIGDPLTVFQGFVLDVRKGFFGAASSLAVSDFQAAASKSYGPFKPALAYSWYSIDLTNAKAYINKLTSGGGLTQIRLRFKLGDNDNAIANILNLYSGSAPLVSKPRLIVEYYVP
jgi:hypothetical protein